MRAKIDQREQQVAEAEAKAAKPSGGKSSLASRVRHAVRKTFIAKHLVNLFIKNMSAHEEHAKEQGAEKE
jgi:CPA2 family monovalent cation:H+ antiporter-2